MIWRSPYLGLVGRIARDRDPSSTLHRLAAAMAHRGRLCGIADRPPAMLAGLVGDAVLRRDGAATRIGPGEASEEQGDVVLVRAVGWLDDEEAQLAASLGLPHDARLDAVVAAGYARWGVEVASKLRGELTAALWDPGARQLLLMRDRLGVRPLYYRPEPEGIAFASEPGALLAVPGATFRPERGQVALLLAEAYRERHETLIEGVLAVPPGHVVIAPQGRDPVVRAYWSAADELDGPTLRGTDAELAEQLEDAFGRAVRARVAASRRPAVLLSGGVDSSAVACMAASQLRADARIGAPLACRLIFPGYACDERRYSQAVADRWQLPVHEVDPSVDARAHTLPADAPIEHFHPTLSTLEALANDAVSSSGADRMLTGMLSDDVFQETGGELWGQLRAGRLVSTARQAGLFAGDGHLAWRLSLAARQGMPGWLRRNLGRLRGGRSPVPRPDALHRSLVPVLEALWRSQGAERLLVSHPDPARERLLQILSSTLDLPLFWSRMDRASARAGLVWEHPFADTRVLRIVTRLPHEQRTLPAHPKPILKRALGERLPRAILERRDAADFSPYLRDVLERQAPALQQLSKESLLRSWEIADFVFPHPLKSANINTLWQVMALGSAELNLRYYSTLSGK